MIITEYYKSHPLPVNWTLEGCQEFGFAGTVVIPALAESNNLLATLLSLNASPDECVKKFLVVVVVNNRPDAREEEKLDNIKTIELLESAHPGLRGLQLAWVDAATPGNEMPLKGGGVGMARKIGCDLALARLDFTDCDPIIIFLDADTVVRADYLHTLYKHFQMSSAGGGVIPFIHQQATTVDGQAAIDRYELFLRSYVFGLKLAGSPYAFHTVGSAMACLASAYMKIGGMNCRQAGEDFYFLQQLSKVVGVSSVSGTVVYPSSRASHRVPFGTGRAVTQELTGDSRILFYQYDCFRILGEWLTLVCNNGSMSSHEIIAAAENINSELKLYLVDIGFVDTWSKLQRNHPRLERFIKAFHDWFDGLKTMKLIHHLSNSSFPRTEPEKTLPSLFNRAGMLFYPDTKRTLELLQQCQQDINRE